MTDRRSMTYKSTTELIPYIGNSRTHSDVQVKQVAASIQEFGFTNPILIDEESGIIAGHGRLLAAELLKLPEVPCIVIAGLTTAQKKALVIADNQLALNADWDMEKLALEMESLKDMEFDLGLIGFDDDFLANLFTEEKTGLTDDDAVPEAPEDPVTVLGDLWLLGDHRLLCGDSTSIDAVERLMGGQKALLLHADPPYGMGKENEGVLNDNLYKNKLDAFQVDWWLSCRAFIEDNAGVYIWGNPEDLWRLWYSDKMQGTERLTFCNEIVWDKGHGQGMGSAEFRCYPPATERCLFFVIGEQGYNNNADNYWEGFEPIRSYLDEQRGLMGWKNKTIADFFGFHPRMADHWFSRSQWSFITQEQYVRLQKEAKNEAFKKDYEELKKAFYDTRAYFDNAHENMTDVFNVPRVVGEERHGHATPKPVDLIGTLIKTSSPKGGLVLEPFGGSGSTLIACQAQGRHCNTMELSPQYCDVIIKRWEQYTGEDAIHQPTGKTYSELANG